MFTGPELNSEGLVYGLDAQSPRCTTSALGASPVLYNIVDNDIMVHTVGTAAYTSVADGNAEAMKKAALSSTSNYISTTAYDMSGGDVTIAAWMKLHISAGTSAQSGFGFHDHNANTGLSLAYRQVATDDVRVGCSTGNGTTRTYITYYGDTTDLLAEGWAYLALTYNDTTDALKLYVNGVQEYSGTYAQSNVSEKIQIGMWSVTYTSASYRTAYSIGLCTIQSVELTAAQLLSNYEATKYRYL